MRGRWPSALGELQVELALVSRDPDAARRELVEVLGLPVQEAVLLEILYVGRDLLEREPESLRQGVTRVQVGCVRGRVVDLAVLEQDSSLQVHRHSPRGDLAAARPGRDYTQGAKNGHRGGPPRRGTWRPDAIGRGMSGLQP